MGSLAFVLSCAETLQLYASKSASTHLSEKERLQARRRMPVVNCICQNHRSAVVLRTSNDNDLVHEAVDREEGVEGKSVLPFLQMMDCDD